ncbi:MULTISPECIES: DUF2752 domain-containing protein [Bizionia]|uniref:DUF2752 domain-containing protein n=1 Tax=Bizionia algoritergicola TaxID=291187 RepID=A0A5D0QTX5_9FLAO|nr:MULTISPECIES: DUF2752 domain-containing protein [Bizionia]OBX21090.1 hypothetical protein BAA08_13970 [Bizionia sp. APA-3]TYB72266.1 DUF2752 domain-containing protein [Bizionia algoritergicola]
MSSPEDFMLPCLNKQIFGFDCMGCGLQRSISLIYHGELVAAFKMYPAVFPLIALFIFIGLNIFFKFQHSNKIINILAIATVIVIIGSFTLKLIT